MNRTELVASLTEQVSNNVEKIAISDSKIEAYYVASYLPVIADCLASIADSLEILTKETEKENKND